MYLEFLDYFGVSMTKYVSADVISIIHKRVCTHCADNDDHQHTAQWENSNELSMFFILSDKRQHDEQLQR